MAAAVLLPPPHSEYDVWERQNVRARPSHQQEQQQKQARHRHQQQLRGHGFPSEQTRPDLCGLLEFSSSLFDSLANSCDIGHILTEIDPSAQHGELAGHDDYFGLLGQSTSDTLATHDDIVPELVPDTVTTTATPSCGCAQDVFKTIRLLKQTPSSHMILHRLRFGVDLFERLLVCPVCYNLAKPPRITIQNVLLIGRLMVELGLGYQSYLRWVRDAPAQSNNEAKTVYFSPGGEASALLSFEIGDLQFQEIVMHGLRTDAQRLSALGSQFSIRQQDRHSIGHETCPSAEGRCWKEENEVDLDPLDICPRNPAAKTLTPCFRVVEEVERTINRIQADIG
ncbi:hypothetical protein NQ176_g2481 [Zarea fungicola]|uniref:Uncharacterized protein n=1 Tax=Zarea fungicola TaxID=93591 RepID=A0ACC1NN43_9HYPO|nr:hypothetical protein NQ176_g2481 [Lecanicillium fungicola]